MTIYVDFDNTIVESHKRIIELLNKRYNLSKTEEDLIDWGYRSIASITEEEKLSLFEENDFFSGLEFKDGFLDVLNKHYNSNEFIIATKGTPKNLEKKIAWIKKNIPYDIKVIGITNDNFSKKQVDMSEGIQIDDCSYALDTNAKIKILYKGGNNFGWQQDYVNTDIMVVNTWKEIDDILFFYSEYDYRTLSKKGEK